MRNRLYINLIIILFNLNSAKTWKILCHSSSEVLFRMKVEKKTDDKLANPVSLGRRTLKYRWWSTTDYVSQRIHRDNNKTIGILCYHVSECIAYFVSGVSVSVSFSLSVSPRQISAPYQDRLVATFHAWVGTVQWIERVAGRLKMQVRLRRGGKRGGVVVCDERAVGGV